MTAISSLNPSICRVSRPSDSTFSENDWKILADFWHPIAYSDLVPVGTLTATTLLDVSLVVTRLSGGEPFVRPDLCPHRGARLSEGTIDGDRLTCPLHGSCFSLDGSDSRLPGLPVRERYGVIWTYLSEQPAESFPEWPEFERDDLRFMRLKPLVWNCAPTRQVENFNDVAHLSWLHTETFGNRERPEIEYYDVVEDGPTLSFGIQYDRASVENIGRNGSIEKTRLDYYLTLPFSSRLTVTVPDGNQYMLFNMSSPMSARQTNLFLRMARSWDLEGDDTETLELQYRVLAEDQPMVEAQRPEELPLDLSEEFFIRADRLSAHYRKALVRLGLGRPLAS